MLSGTGQFVESTPCWIGGVSIDPIGGQAALSYKELGSSWEFGTMAIPAKTSLNANKETKRIKATLGGETNTIQRVSR